MDLPALEQYVVNTFGRIATNGLPPDDFTSHAFKPDAVTPEFRSIYYIKPVSDITEVGNLSLHSPSSAFIDAKLRLRSF